MSDTYGIELTQLESLYLSDFISMFMQGVPDATISDRVMPYPNLLLKIGGAVQETGEEKKEVSTIHVSLADLWVMREVTKSSAIIGGEPVGLNLLFKVYAGIRKLSAGSETQTLVDDYGEGSENEPGKKDYQVEMDQIKSGIELKGESDDDDKATAK